MNEFGFAVCDHVFSFECSGEVGNLIRATERYGILVENTKIRIEALCRQCRKFSRPGNRQAEDKEN